MSAADVEAIRERAFRVMEWADLNGDDLAGALRLDPDDDAETIKIINDALLAAADAFHALGAARLVVGAAKEPSR